MECEEPLSKGLLFWVLFGVIFVALILSFWVAP